MSKTLIAFAALAALVAPASAQVVSPRESSQIVSPAFQGNASVDATVTRGLQNDGRFNAPASAPVNNDLQRGNQGDTFGAQSR
ncbi:MAG: hypothetical protein INR68_09925 [Methylobacterium mesophilicum]|nr:hypothetical protein [Methylobacterium mesophilicum]